MVLIDATWASYRFADDTLSGVASEHGPVSFRTERLIPWTIGNHPASSLDSNYL